MDPSTATAADFDKDAKQHANVFGGWVIAACIFYYFYDWLALLPGAMAVYNLFQAVNAKRCADQLRKGTYPFPNPNNGAPDGDARNRGQ